MTTDTNTATENTNAGAGEGDKSAAAAGGDAGTNNGTALTGDAGTTAEDAKAGEKGAGTELTDEQKAEAEKAAADKAAADKAAEEADKAAGPPEKYEFALPDGMELDTALLEKADPVLRELGLSNEQAGKLANLIAEERVSEAQRQQDAYAQQVEDWGKSAREDKEFGGANFEKSVPIAQKAIAQFGTPELKALLADGLGNHPELIRFCVRVGKAMGEDTGVGEGNKTPTEKSAAALMFDHPTSQPKR